MRTAILIIFLITSNVSSLRILGLFPLNARSHFAPCGELMRGLAVKGHHVDVYSHYPLTHPLPNYHDISLAGSLPDVTNNLTYEVTELNGPSEAITSWLEFGGKPACELMVRHQMFRELYHAPPKDPPYDLVIVEVSLANCYIAWGRYLSVPVIGIVAPLLPDWLHEHLDNPVNLAVEPSSFAPFAIPETFLQRLRNFYTYHHLRLSFNYHVRKQDAYVERLFGPGYPNAVELQKDLALVLVNHQPALSGLRTFPPSVIPVGGLHIVDHNETLPQVVQKWLDESEHGFVYFSFGSMIRVETFPRHVLDAFFKTFENISPIRVLLKIAKPEDLPLALPSNVISQSWLPQIQILKHEKIRAFVTHGGLMGTQEAAYYGVPMVGIPLISDEFFNIENCVRAKLAVKVDLRDITEKVFTNALWEILNDPLYKQNADRVSKHFRDVPMSPMDMAIFWIEYIARHGKDALRSPLVDMPWWQASLLDVYCFIIAILALTLYVIRKICKKLLRLLRVYKEMLDHSNVSRINKTK